MPWTLVRETDGTFTFSPLDADSPFGGWASREVGDADTNPTPSFIGKGIASMFVYSNRLGFVAGDAVIMSQPGDYFNFFNTSAIAISDADPIDLSASSEKPVILKHAIGTAKGLLVFSEHAQFSIATDEVVFSSQTVQMKQVTDYSFCSETLLNEHRFIRDVLNRIRHLLQGV